MRGLWITLTLGQALICPHAAANDRLPERWREGYAVARGEVQRYMGYILLRVWGERLGTLRAQAPARAALARQADATTDEIVHLLLPEARRIVRDGVFGTDSTHLRLTQPELREKAAQKTLSAIRERQSSPSRTVLLPGMMAEEALDDRLEQALTEDMEDYAQQWVESAVGLPVQGRSRARMRPLPEKWASRYAEEARLPVHRFTYWRLRKRRRSPLTFMAFSMSREELDRARHEGPVWSLTAGASYEVWAQNRIRLDFRYGRHNWEIHRRRIRRRMDQDLAEATWAMARMVKELHEPETLNRLQSHLEKRLEEELAKQPKLAADYPRTRSELSKTLERVRRELDPIMNEAIGRVPFPKDMTAPLRDLAGLHGRRFMHEEMSSQAKQALGRAATPHIAERRVGDRLPGMVRDALSRLDLPPPPADRLAPARAGVKKEVRPYLLEEIREALRLSGQGESQPMRPEGGGPPPEERIYEKLNVDRAIDHEVERQLQGE
jgi:hypothetical protein